VTDLSSARMDFSVFSANPELSEAYVTFRRDDGNPEGDDNIILEPKTLAAPIGTEASDAALDLVDAISDGRDDKRQQMQTLLCERVAHCHGVVNGEC
jgi:hypothetical protein